MQIPPVLTHRILRHLALEKAQPSPRYLAAIVNAYVQSVPWESASRIVRRAHISATAACPRWPAEFWEDALQRGLGGTCFESNYAFLALLQALGFRGYLTINDMAETVGCHTATVIELDGAQWLADVGFPVLAPLQLNVRQRTTAASPWLSFSAQPQPENRFVIERAPHPAPYVFTLRNTPVADADYCAATISDYGPNGFFLREVVINKVVDGMQWRLSTRDLPLHLECFVNGQRIDTPLNADAGNDHAAHTIATQFGIDEAVLREALSRVLV